jgi:hypothetical protein
MTQPFQANDKLRAALAARRGELPEWNRGRGSRGNLE